MKFTALSALGFLALFSCTGDDTDQQTPAADGGDEVADAVMGPGCHTPSRIIVLGDSIAACAGVGGKEGADCGPKIFHSSLTAGHLPGIVYENISVSGALTTDVPDRQLANISAGTGHALVLIYVGGNDMQKYLTLADGAAQAGLTNDMPGIIEDWESIFSHFDDTTMYPEGVTIIMNNQYNPFDDCTAPPYNLSATKSGLLGDFNAQLQTLADSKPNVVITDQHTPFLGHGHHNEVASCPHYQAGLDNWMNDLIHPNAGGHKNLADQWDKVANTLYGSCE